MAPDLKHDLRVLLVEDDDLDAKVVERLLGGPAWSVHHVRTISTARAALATTPFDVVLLDVNLPDCHGEEGLTRIRRLSPDVAIVVISNASYDPEVAEAFDSGAQDLLRKDELDGPLLERSIRYAVERQSRIADNRRLQMLDPQTELPNRRFFDMTLEREVARALRFGGEVGYVHIDLDRVRNINARLGYAAGDHAIEEVARRLQARVRTSDLLARIGGDEFGLMLDGVRDASAARRVAEQLIEEAGQPIEINGQYETLSFSVGVSTLSEAGSLDALRAGAARALEEAQEAGGNRVVVWSRAGDAAWVRRLEIEGALPGAEERGELRVTFQPVYELKRNELLGFEALVRWRWNGSDVSPAEFIPIAEEIGQIDAIGSFVLREASRFAAGFAPMDYRVNVNLSAAEFRNRDVVEDVVRATRAAGTHPSQFTFEVTESIFSDARGTAGAQLEGLRRLGSKIAIDDFGTGYSSLSQLRHLPVDILKLDRSFVSESVQDRDAALLTRGIIALGHGLQLDVIAEGIETDAEWQFVVDSGCTSGQGYLLGRPLEVADANELIHQSARQRQRASLG